MLGFVPQRQPTTVGFGINAFSVRSGVLLFQIRLALGKCNHQGVFQWFAVGKKFHRQLISNRLGVRIFKRDDLKGVANRLLELMDLVFRSITYQYLHTSNIVFTGILVGFIQFYSLAYYLFQAFLLQSFSPH